MERVGLFQGAVSQDCGVNGPGPIVSVLEALWFPAAGQQTPDPESHPFTLFCSGHLQTPRRQSESQIWKGDLSVRKDLGWKCEFGAVIL